MSKKFNPDELVTETRPCGECEHFKDMGKFYIPICKKKLMGVTRGMHVSFKRTEGTCWTKPKTEILPVD